MRRGQSIALLGLILLFIFGISNKISPDIEQNYISPTTPRNQIETISNNPKISLFSEDETLSGYNYDDSGRAIAVDTDGNLYLTGNLYNHSNGYYEVLIAKYNKSGIQEWNRTWAGDDNSIGYGIDVDKLNNIFITGSTTNNTGNVNLLVLKYDSNGNHLWNATFGGNDWDIGYGIMVNDTNSILIAGYSESFGIMGDAILLNYNSTGHLQWYRTCGGLDTDSTYNLDIDSEGNIYLVGYTSSFGIETSAGYLIKYNRTGDFRWNITWGGEQIDDFYDIELRSDNEILIVGNTKSYSQGGYDGIILLYNATGVLQSNATWGGAENDYCHSLTFDSHNNAFITGYTMSYGGIDKDVCVVKFNSTLDFQWYKLWEGSQEDIAYGIINNGSGFLYITGKTQISGSNYDTILLTYSLRPDTFTISSNTTLYDTDGTFTLSWEEALDAENYTLYQFNKKITEINDSLTILAVGNTNRIYNIKAYPQGDYYFAAVARNKFGNITSQNCLKITVLYPPGEFQLEEISENPDLDGMINFTWGISERFANYSIYSHSSYIQKIDNNGTLVKEGLTNQSYVIDGLLNQDIYYIIVAFNQAGQNQSNCIEVIVRRKPVNFTLESTAGNPESDGNFDLEWTNAEFAENYSIYFSTSYITNIHDATVELILEEYDPEFEWPKYTHPIDGKSTGIYYYIVYAFNQYGNGTSNVLKVEVKFPISIAPDDDDNDDDKSDNNDSSYVFIFGIVGSITSGSIAVLGMSKWYFNHHPRKKKMPILPGQEHKSTKKKAQKPIKHHKKNVLSKRSKELKEKFKEKSKAEQKQLKKDAKSYTIHKKRRIT